MEEQRHGESRKKQKRHDALESIRLRNLVGQEDFILLMKDIALEVDVFGSSWRAGAEIHYQAGCRDVVNNIFQALDRAVPGTYAKIAGLCFKEEA
jgi:hypothetical protein